jgi:hypothetical protein
VLFSIVGYRNEKSGQDVLTIAVGADRGTIFDKEDLIVIGQMMLEEIDNILTALQDSSHGNISYAESLV